MLATAGGNEARVTFLIMYRGQPAIVPISREMNRLIAEERCYWEKKVARGSATVRRIRIDYYRCYSRFSVSKEHVIGPPMSLCPYTAF